MTAALIGLNIDGVSLERVLLLPAASWPEWEKELHESFIDYELPDSAVRVAAGLLAFRIHCRVHPDLDFADDGLLHCECRKAYRNDARLVDEVRTLMHGWRERADAIGAPYGVKVPPKWWETT